MAATKLTLSIEPGTVAKAKRYASKHNISISKLFSNFISNIADKDVEEDPLLKKIREMEIPDDIKALTGILKGKVPDDINLWDAKYEYLKEKYDL